MHGRFRPCRSRVSLGGSFLILPLPNDLRAAKVRDKKNEVFPQRLASGTMEIAVSEVDDHDRGRRRRPIPGQTDGH
jgi:hypothetical protein